VEFIISQRFQTLAPGLFQQSVEKMSLANLPSFASPEFHQRSTSPFASNLTATWGEFFNESHIDNDVNSISYGGWCGINEKTGQPASWDDGFDIQYGQFFLPGISTVVDFNAVDGWTDMFWASNYLFHQTVKSQRPSQSPFTRFGFSVQINNSFYNSGLAAIGRNDLIFGGTEARDAEVRNRIFPSCKSIFLLICCTADFLLHDDKAKQLQSICHQLHVLHACQITHQSHSYHPTSNSSKYSALLHNTSQLNQYKYNHLTQHLPSS